MIDVKVGDRVYIITGGGDKVEYAIVLWVGQLPPEHVGANVGTFAGIQFDNPVGKGTGSLGPIQYFHAKSGHAAFVPASMLQKVNADSNSLFSSAIPNDRLHNTNSSSTNNIYEPQHDINNRPIPSPIGTKPISPIGTKPTVPSPPSSLTTPRSHPRSIIAPNIGGVGASSPYMTPTSSGGFTPFYNGFSSKNITCGTRSISLLNQDREMEEELFESDDDLEEALKVEEAKISDLAKKMSNLSSGDDSNHKSAEKKKKQKTSKPNNNSGEGDGAASSWPAPSPLVEENESSSPPPAPTSSTEWSVVASKIKKAPKQVRDQMKPAEKKPTTPVKTKTKIEKLLDENPKYKSTLCNWYMQGARCPNGATCHFAHGESEMRSVPRPKFKYKTQVCSYYAAGHCGNGSTCHFAHGLTDLQK